MGQVEEPLSGQKELQRKKQRACVSEWEKEVLGRRCESEGKRNAARKVPALVSVFVCKSDKRSSKEFGCRSHHGGGRAERIWLFSHPQPSRKWVWESCWKQMHNFSPEPRLTLRICTILALRDRYSFHISLPFIGFLLNSDKSSKVQAKTIHSPANVVLKGFVLWQEVGLGQKMRQTSLWWYNMKRTISFQKQSVFIHILLKNGLSILYLALSIING